MGSFPCLTTIKSNNIRLWFWIFKLFGLVSSIFSTFFKSRQPAYLTTENTGFRMHRGTGRLMRVNRPSCLLNPAKAYLAVVSFTSHHLLYGGQYTRLYLTDLYNAWFTSWCNKILSQCIFVHWWGDQRSTMTILDSILPLFQRARHPLTRFTTTTPIRPL